MYTIWCVHMLGERSDGSNAIMKINRNYCNMHLCVISFFFKTHSSFEKRQLVCLPNLHKILLWCCIWYVTFALLLFFHSQQEYSDFGWTLFLFVKNYVVCQNRNQVTNLLYRLFLKTYWSKSFRSISIHAASHKSIIG